MIRTLDTIIDQMRVSLEETNSELADFPLYGNLYSIFRAVGASIIEQDVKLETLNSSLFLSTATGNSLDDKAKEFNIVRKLGTASSGGVICLGGTSNIAADTILTDNKTGLQFSIINTIIINNGSRSTGSIQCTEFTPFGNLKAGTELVSSLYPNLKFIVGTSYNVFTNLYQGSLVGGSFREDDDILKIRILNTLQSLSLSTVQALQLEALNTNGVSRISVVENVPSLGYITVYINNAQANIINTVSKKLKAIKPIGVALQVLTYTDVPIDLTISISTSALPNSITLLNNTIISAAHNYINSLNQGDTVTKEGLAASILKIPNITNINVVSPASNILIKSNEIATLNNTNISYLN